MLTIIYAQKSNKKRLSTAGQPCITNTTAGHGTGLTYSASQNYVNYRFLSRIIYHHINVCVCSVVLITTHCLACLEHTNTWSNCHYLTKGVSEGSITKGDAQCVCVCVPKIYAALVSLYLVALLLVLIQLQNYKFCHIM